jgi:hypothetical protein
VSEIPDQIGDHPEMVIDSILHQHPRLDHDVFQMDAQVWAIHGYIPVDGEVILAEYDRRDTAKAVLAQLAAAQDVTEMGRTISKAVEPGHSDERDIPPSSFGRFTIS